MFRNILSSRGLIVGVVFFVVCVGGSLLYGWHVRRNSAAEMARTDQSLQQLRNKKETRTTQDATVPTDADSLKPTETSMEIDDTGPEMSEETETLPPLDDLADVSLPDDIVSTEEELAEDVPVSPFGFGPYPEVPADYPFTPFWFDYHKDPERYDAKHDTEMLKSRELLSRVMVKAWTEGTRGFTGGSGSLTTGKYYLHFPNTIYVEYGEPFLNDDGTVTTPISSYTGGNVYLTHEQMLKGEIPSGVRVIEGGYDPYEYLDLR